MVKRFVVLAAACGSLLGTAETAAAACNTRACEERVVLKIKAAVVRPWSGKLDRIAWCESRGRWWLATGNGFFGGLQFTIKSWLAVGGRGMPHQASVLEQKYRGVRLIAVQGFSAWPNCGAA